MPVIVGRSSSGPAQPGAEGSAWPVELVLGKVLNRLAGVLLVAVALVALVAPRDPNLTYSRWRVSAFFAVLLLGAVVVHLGRGRWPVRRAARWSDRRYRVLSVLVTVAGAAGCTLLAWALRYDAGWDARVVAEMSHRLVAGHDLTAYQYGYLSRYPNNLPLLVVDNLCGRVGERAAPGARDRLGAAQRSRPRGDAAGDVLARLDDARAGPRGRRAAAGAGAGRALAVDVGGLHGPGLDAARHAGDRAGGGRPPGAFPGRRHGVRPARRRPASSSPTW